VADAEQGGDDPHFGGVAGQEADAGAGEALYAGLSLRQGLAVEALLQGQPMAKAALAAGVNRRTLRRWVQRPRFRDTLLAARRESFQQAVGLTSRYAPVAVATLVKVMNDQLASPSARVAAAAVLLKFGREGIELDDLAARVEALETAAALVTAVPRLPKQVDQEDEQ
jgi:transposase-like protein